MQKKYLLVKEINIPQNNLPRVITGTKNGIIENYAEQMADGIKFPPIKVWKNGDGGPHWMVWDGVHRLSAAKAIGMEKIDCEAHDFPENEFLLWAFSANIKHGLPLKHQEKVNVTRALYKNGHSVQTIAEKTGIQERTLQRWIQDLADDKKNERNKKAMKLLEQGSTQEEVAKKMGIAQTTVGRICKNDICRFCIPNENIKNNDQNPSSNDQQEIKPEIPYKKMTYEQRFGMSKMPLKDCMKKGVRLSDWELNVIRTLELIKGDWDIEKIQKDTGLGLVEIRNAAIILMAHHDKKLFYENGKQWVAEMLRIDWKKVSFIWSLRHFEKALPDRFKLLCWLRESLRHNSDEATKEFIRIETLNQLCIEKGVETPDQLTEEIKYDILEELPPAAKNYLQECADKFQLLTEMFTYKRLQKKPFQELSEYYNQLIVIENGFRDIIIENGKKICE